MTAKPVDCAAGASVITFTVPGKPAPQGSKRHVGRGILVESSREVGPWRERVALVARGAMDGRPIITGAVAIDVEFVLPRPKSTPKRRTPLATKKPDLDKLIRAAGDAITDVVIADDSQVVDLHGTKRLAEIGEPPGAHIVVTALVTDQIR
jgi:crossover junction endodeoxyribonuclease RusA